MDLYTNNLLVLEHRSCVALLPKEIVVQPSLRTFREWRVYAFIPNGFYAGKTLCFSLDFEKYPNGAPRVIFQTGVVHPNIENGVFRTEEIIQCWNRAVRVHELIEKVYSAISEFQSGNNSILEQIKNPDPNESPDFNSPKRWTNQKEKLCQALNNQ